MFNQKLKVCLNQKVQSHLPRLEKLYRHFHANPELSCHEEKTAARAAQELKALGIEVHTGIGGYGLVGVMENGPGPCVLLRADMDALPLKELTGLPFASEAVGISPDGKEMPVMHACGHDLHTTCLLGAAAVFNDMRDFWQGSILFIVQPAEETIGGADLMMKDRIYERFGRPDHAIALHVAPYVAAGCVALAPGVQSSCNHSIDLIVKGMGGHGASPHQTKDPVVLSAQIIMALQSIISREVDPRKMGVITVGAIHGGTKRNIIPEEVVLSLSIRAFEMELAARLVEAIKRTANGLAKAQGLPEDLWPRIEIPEMSYPPVINDPDLTETVKSALCDVLGKDQVGVDSSSSGSEDFSFFANGDPPVPILMYKLGVTEKKRLEAAENGGPKVSPLHDPRFCPDLDPSLATGVKSMAAAALSVLETKEQH